MGKKWIEGLMILAALWAMTGCGKQEMIRCEYTNETAGFTLSIDRPVEWTAKLQDCLLYTSDAADEQQV